MLFLTTTFTTFFNNETMSYSQPTEIDFAELHYMSGNSEIFRIIKNALISKEAEFEESLHEQLVKDEICYDLYMMEFNMIKFEFIIRFCDGELDKFFVNVKSISADLCRSTNVVSDYVEEDKALSNSNQSIVDIWNKSGLKHRYEAFNARCLKKDKGEIKAGMDRFFCECDCFDIIMTMYRGEQFNVWISGDEFVMDPPRIVYVLWGKSKEKKIGWLVKIGSTNDINSRIKNIRNSECSVIEYEACEVPHGKTAEGVMRKMLHGFDYSSVGGATYKNEWLRFNRRCDARKFFEDHWNELIENAKKAKIGKFVSKPQSVSSRTVEIRKGFEVEAMN